MDIEKLAIVGNTTNVRYAIGVVIDNKLSLLLKFNDMGKFEREYRELLNISYDPDAMFPLPYPIEIFSDRKFKVLEELMPNLE